MSNLRKVLSARLHTTINIVGYGQAGGSHPVVAGHAATGPNGGKPAIELFKSDDGLVIKSRSFEVLVPFANVQMMVLAPEEVTSDKTGLVAVKK